MSAEEAPSILDAALDYAARGLPVIPLKRGAKSPVTKNGSKDATTEPATIEFWSTRYPHHELGIATGHPLPGGGKLVVIDIDPDHGGAASWAKLTDEYGHPGATLQVKTPSGGRHLYLRVPEDVDVRNFQSRRDGWDGIDLRGSGGYVVAPPSMGGKYVVIDDAPIVLISDAWLKLLTTSRGSTSLVVRGDFENKPIPEGSRNEFLTAHAGAMRRRGLSADEMLPALQKLNERCAPPLDDSEVAKISVSMLRYTPEDPPEVRLTELGAARSVVTQLKVQLDQDETWYAHPEFLSAYCAVEQMDNQAEAKAIAIMKRAKVPVRMFQKALKDFKSKNREAAGLAAVIDVQGAPLDLVMPEGWRCTMQGVQYLGGEDGPERVLPVPLYLTRRLRTVEEQEEKVELQYHRDGVTHRLVVDRSVASQARTITALADRGLPVTSENAGRIVRYIADMEAANLDTIPLEEATTQAGWIGSSHFYPGAESTIQFAPPEWSDINERSFAPSGDENEWMTTIRDLSSSHSLLRLSIAASFAAPLLKPAEHRSFVLHLWGDSGGGKSASLMAATSVWGSPTNLMGNFNTTAVGLESKMGLMNGLPVALNERQVGGKSWEIDKLIYMAGEGKGRTRGARAGGLRRSSSWQMILLTNGEEPLIGESAPEGVRTRVLEFMGRPIDDEADARRLYPIVERSYGWAGRTFAAKMIESLKANPKAIRDVYGRWMIVLSNYAPDRVVSHISALALCAAADELAAQWVWGASVDDSIDSCSDWIHALVDQVPAKGDRSEGQREWEFVQDLIKANRSKFTTTESGRVEGHAEHWGMLRNEIAYILPSVFDRELERANFRPVAAKHRLDKMGVLRSEPNGSGSKRLVVRVFGSRYVALRLGSSLYNSLTSTTSSEESGEEVDGVDGSVHTNHSRWILEN